MLRTLLLSAAVPALTLGASASTVDGFLGFFEGNCPKGWSELTAAQGRLLLSVNNSYQAGAAIGFPLSDGEDRAHSHVVSGAFSLSPQQVSALGGSNTDSAHSGKQPLLGFVNGTSASTSGLPFVQLTCCRYNAISFQPAPSLPVGGVALWDPASATTGCPAGSAPLSAASGRLLVLSNASGLASNAAAPPLEPGKDIQHAHDFSVSISVDSINFLGIHGCCDNDVAQHGDATATGTSTPTSLGLPYLSLLTCNVTASTAPLALPAGMVFLTTDPSGCPAGWAPATAYAGRALVATPAFGIPGKVWGGAALITAAAPYPQHAPHAFGLSVQLYPAGVELATQSGGSYGRAGTIDTAGSTVPQAQGPSEQLPLVQVLACSAA